MIENSNKIYIIAEIGINHNGDLDIASQSKMPLSVEQMKFQKENVEKVYSEEILTNIESPGGTLKEIKKWTRVWIKRI